MDSDKDEIRVNNDSSFTELQAILDEFLRTKEKDDMLGELSNGLQSRAQELLCPDPLRCYPRTPEDRSALQSGNVVLKGLRVKLPPDVVPELVLLSDELNINELFCVELWMQVDESWQRRALEKRLAEPVGSLSNDLPLAVRKLYYLERHSLLFFLSGLFKAALMPGLCSSKRDLVDRGIFALLEQGLAPNLMSFVAELLGPEGLRRAPPTTSVAAGQAPVPGVFGTPANPAQVGAPASGGGVDNAGGGGLSEAAARREKYMLDSLLTAVEVLFFIYYSYQIKPEEAKQLVTLLETAGRELLAFQQIVGESVVIPSGGSLPNGFGMGAGSGLFGAFGGGTTRATASASTTTGLGIGEERQQDVVRLCAVMEATSVLLCTLSIALSQDFALYGRNAPGERNDGGNLPALIASGGVDGGGNGQLFGGSGSASDVMSIDNMICHRTWDHRQVQASALAVWVTFVAPFAAGKETFAATVNAEKHIKDVAASASAYGAVKFLRGPVLATLRHPPFPNRDLTPRPFYLEALSSLAGAYIVIILGNPPLRLEEQMEELESSWNGGAGRVGFGEQQQQPQQNHISSQEQRRQEMLDTMRKEDTLEDVMYWAGQLAEAHPDFAEKKLWEGEDQSMAGHLATLTFDSRDLLAPMLFFLAGAALKTPEHVHRLMITTGCGWSFFIRNIEVCAAEMARSLEASQPVNQSVGGRVSFSGPTPPVKISDRTYAVLEPLCVLLQRVMLHEGVRRQPLVPGDNQFRVMVALMNLLRTGVRPSMKGAIFKVLAAMAKDREYANHIWNFIEEAQLVPTAGGGQARLDAGGKAVDNIYGGLFVEMDLIESRNGTYPGTEGFCCLIQELVLHDLPYDLGERRRYSGAGGIQPYVAYLLDCVLMTDLRFAEPGERWRIVARVLQVMLTLLRRYPLTGSRVSRSGSSPLPTAKDEEACRMDFDASAASKRRCKSPGYYILRQILGQGGLFRQLVQVLRSQGGVNGLKTVRLGSATAAVLKYLLPKTLDGASSIDRLGFGGAGGAAALTSGSPSAGTAQGPLSILPPIKPGEPGPDWSWWRERSVLLALSILDAVSEREKAFVDQWKGRINAGGSDDDDDFTVTGGFGGVGGGGVGVAVSISGGGTAGSGGGIGRGGFGGVRKGGGVGSLAPPAYLGQLLSEGNVVAAIARYIEYDANMAIPLLSASVLLSCSRNLPSGTMMDTLLASDPRECDALAEAYTACLAADGAVGGRASPSPSLETMLSPPNNEADTDFMTLHAVLIGAGTSERNWEGEEGALRIVRLGILDLLLENVENRGLNLAHFLLGLVHSSISSVHSAVPSRRASTPTACLEALVELLLSPGFMQEESHLAEKCTHLLYKLCASKDTRVAVLDRLRNASRARTHEAFFPQMLRVALAKRDQLPSAPEDGDKEALSFERHSLAWLLKSAAIDIRTACEGSPVHVSHAKALLRALFVVDGPAGESKAELQKEVHEKNRESSPAARSDLPKPPAADGVGAAPLLTLLESKIELRGGGPPRNLVDITVQGLLVASGIPLPEPGGSAEAGGQGFRIMDLDHLQRLILEAIVAEGHREGVPLSEEAAKRMNTSLTWAAQWNEHTIDLASQAHLCQAWRQAMEVAFGSAGVLLFGPAQEPSKGVAPRRLLPALLLGILKNLSESRGAEERLLQQLGRACMSVTGILRDLGPWAPLELNESKEIMSGLISSLVGAEENEAPQGEGSKSYRAYLHGCLVLLLEHTHEDARSEVDVELPGIVGQAQHRPAASSSQVSSSDTHRMQNRKMLIKRIQPLVILLADDARNAPNMTQTLGLSLLSSIMATLGNGASGSGNRRVPVHHPTAESAGSSEQDMHINELLGCRTRAQVLNFLHTQAFFSDVSRLLSGARPGSDAPVPGIVITSVLGFLTRVACSADGAEYLLDAGVVERVAESESIAKSSQIVAQTATLAPFGATRSETAGVFQPQGPDSLRDLVIPGLLLLQGMLRSIPENVMLAERVAAFLAKHAQLVQHLLYLRDRSLDGLDAMSAVLGILAHVSKKPFEGVLDRHVGNEKCQHWRSLAERALVGFGSNPLPQGRVDGGGGWWAALQPITEWEKHLARKQCQAPPGGALEWSMFDSAKLEASQRALARSVDYLRFSAAAETKRALKARSGLETSPRPWLAEKPEELCLVLRACVDTIRGGGGGGAGRGLRFGRGLEGATVRVNADGRFVRGLQYVVEGLLAAFLHLVDNKSDEGRGQLPKYRKGLVSTLTELLQDTSSDPFVLLAARALIERVSGREEDSDSGMNTN